jgi:hypothetical protein
MHTLSCTHPGRCGTCAARAVKRSGWGVPPTHRAHGSLLLSSAPVRKSPRRAYFARSRHFKANMQHVAARQRAFIVEVRVWVRHSTTRRVHAGQHTVGNRHAETPAHHAAHSPASCHTLQGVTCAPNTTRGERGKGHQWAAAQWDTARAGTAGQIIARPHCSSGQQRRCSVMPRPCALKTADGGMHAPAAAPDAPSAAPLPGLGALLPITAGATYPR